MLSASACNTCDSSSASPYMRSSGIVCRASSNSPGFSYLVGVNDRLMRRLRNFCESRSVTAGAVGILGRCRRAEYEGGVAGPLEVAGLLSVMDIGARKLALDARCERLGEGCRLFERRSFMRLSRRSPSNFTRRSYAHSSPYSPCEEGAGLKASLRPAIVKGRRRTAAPDVSRRRVEVQWQRLGRR